MTHASELKRIECQSRQEWLEARRIGGSDAAVIVGVSKRKSAFTLYEEFIGEMPRDDLEDVELIRWGNLLEPPIREETARRLEIDIDYPGPFTSFYRTCREWMTASVDGLIEHPTEKVKELFASCDLPAPVRGRGILEIKTASAYKGREWRSSDGESGPEWPLDYQVQSAHYLAVLDLQWGICACLIGGQRLELVPFVRNRQFENVLIAYEEHFWRCVQNREAPTVDDSESTSRTLRVLHSQDNGEEVYLDDEELIAIARRLEFAKKEKGEIEREIRWCDNRLRHAIGDATFARLRDGTRFSLKTSTRKEHLVKESTYRTLRRVKS